MENSYILGISAFYHDSAAALLKDGEVIAAAQEERFSRKKHDHSFPRQSIDYCLKEAGISTSQVDYAAFYEKPFIKFERLITTYLAFAPFGVRSFIKAMPLWLKQKLFIKNYIEKELNFSGKILFPEHHLSHAASAFYPCPFDEAAILTIDGVGEWTTTSFGIGKDNSITLFSEIKFPHSLGLLYAAFTYYLGFKINSGEYKLMGLAPYGEPKYVDLIKREIIDIKEDGSFKLNLKYFNFCVGLTMVNKKFSLLFGGPGRKPDTDKIEQRHMDIARSIQLVTEEIILKMVRFVQQRTKQKRLCLAGGVALNCVANGKILQQGLFEDIWIQPAATDAGGALGAVLAVWFGYLKNKRETNGYSDSMNASLLGPGFSKEKIEGFLKESNIPYEALEQDKIAETAARIISEQKVLGWFQGRMEYGPRALGNRSILADPRSEQIQSIINLKIKFRESFRPFAPSVLSDKAGEYFELNKESPYMLLTAAVNSSKRLHVNNEETLFGIDKLRVKRSIVPAITHVDYSARVQTVKREDSPLFYDLIYEFYKRTDCPVLVNTSFNVRGEPIVCTPVQAYNCFMRTNMDYLIMGSFLLDKAKQPQSSIKTGDLSGFEADQCYSFCLQSL